MIKCLYGHLKARSYLISKTNLTNKYMQLMLLAFISIYCIHNITLSLVELYKVRKIFDQQDMKINTGR